MGLNKEQIDKLIKKLIELKINNCPVCKSDKLVVSDVVFEIREFKKGALVLGSSKIAPLISVTCENCGNIILFNAIKLGVIKINE